MSQNLTGRTLLFGVAVVKLIRATKKDYSLIIILNQLLRSGTSIGANFEEAQNANSKDDFIYKVGVSLREAKETRYWLRIMAGASLMAVSLLEPLLKECEELIKILTTIVKKAKERRE